MDAGHAPTPGSMHRGWQVTYNSQGWAGGLRRPENKAV